MSVLPRPLAVLGLAGVLPQAACLAACLFAPDSRWFALAAGCCYAAVILSFLGGMWWMLGLVTGRSDAGIYIVAVVPSLVGWAALLPWCFGWPWPQSSLVYLAVCLFASPLVDWRVMAGTSLPRQWLTLRVVMATGLGLTTGALALV